MHQLRIDFSAPRIVDDEKKTELISFRIGARFKDDLDAIATAKHIDRSSLLFEYAIQGYLEDYKNILLLQVRADKTIREMLR